MELESPSARGGSFSVIGGSSSASSSTTALPSVILQNEPPKHNKIGSIFMFKFKSFDITSEGTAYKCQYSSINLKSRNIKTTNEESNHSRCE